jgi:hypothetical protein
MLKHTTPAFPMITRSDVECALWHIGEHHKVAMTYSEAPGLVLIDIGVSLWGWLIGRSRRASRMLQGLIREQAPACIDHRVYTWIRFTARTRPPLHLDPLTRPPR